MNIVALAECCEFIKDGTHNTPEKVSQGVPVLSAGNVYGGQLSFDTNRFATEEELAIFRKRLHPKVGDVLLTIVGTIGRAAVLTEDKPLVFQRSVCVLRPSPELLDSLYFRYALESEFVQKQFEKEQQGVAQMGIYLETLKEIRIPLLPLTEQKRIASLLARADRLRQLRRTAHDLGESLLQSVFLEMFGDIKTNSKNWDMCIIDDVVEFSQYGTSEKSNSEKRGYPVLGMPNITYEGRLDLEKLSYVDLNEKEFAQLKLERGDVIFNRTNSTELVGKTTYWNYDFDAVIASYLVKLKLKKDTLPEFFVTLLNMPHYKNMFQERCKKAVGQSNISPTLLKEFPIFVPPLSLQEGFAGVVRRIDVLRGRMGESERQVEGLFESLLAEAFSYPPLSVGHLPQMRR